MRMIKILSVLLLLVGTMAVTIDTARADIPPGGRDIQPGAIHGIVTANGRPVAGALVVLHHNGAAVARTQTNDRGEYSFPRIRPGTYGVTAEKRGVGHGGARVTVRPGQTVRVPIALAQ